MNAGLNTYRKLADGTWAILCHVGPNTVANLQPKTGSTVIVSKKNGTTNEETLGDFLGTFDGAMTFRLMPKKAERKIADVGELSGVMAIFDKAKTHLKYPKITLAITEKRDGEPKPIIIETIRINVAGAKAKVPGSLNVVSMDKTDGFDAYGNPRRVWYGRIHPDGRFEQTKVVTPKHLDKLRAFAADPAKVAGEDGRLMGNCCFCRLPLKDERSTHVGYGATCAAHYHLPWGERPEEKFAA